MFILYVFTCSCHVNVDVVKAINFCGGGNVPTARGRSNIGVLIVHLLVYV